MSVNTLSAKENYPTILIFCMQHAKAERNAITLLHAHIDNVRAQEDS